MLEINNIRKEIREDGRTELSIYFPPPLYYSLNTAVNLSIFLAMPETHKWFYNCMVQLAFYKNWKEDRANHPLDIYPANMLRLGRHGGLRFWHEHIVDIGGTILKVEKNDFIDQIVCWIDKGLYISSNADVSKLPGTKYYNRESYTHGFMVFGYDKKKKIIKMVNFDEKGHLAVLDIPYQALEDAVYLQEKPRAIMLLMPKKGVNYNFDMELYNTFLSDYVGGYDTVKRYRHIHEMSGDYIWGLNIYESFKEFIEYSHTNLEELDFRPFHTLYEHKKCILNGMEYLESTYFQKEIKKFKVRMEALIRETERLRMMALKYSVSKDEKLVVRMVKLVSAIADEEKGLLREYYNVCKQWKQEII